MFWSSSMSNSGFRRPAIINQSELMCGCNCKALCVVPLCIYFDFIYAIITRYFRGHNKKCIVILVIRRIYDSAHKIFCRKSKLYLVLFTLLYIKVSFYLLIQGWESSWRSGVRAGLRHRSKRVRTPVPQLRSRSDNFGIHSRTYLECRSVQIRSPTLSVIS